MANHQRRETYVSLRKLLENSCKRGHHARHDRAIYGAELEIRFCEQRLDQHGVLIGKVMEMSRNAPIRYPFPIVMNPDTRLRISNIKD